MEMKKEGVMKAIKGRKKIGDKKGLGLMGIVEKLTAKRKMLGKGGCGVKK